MTDATLDVKPVSPWRLPAENLRAYGSSSRIIGVDLARGLAVLGMFGAHVGATQAFDWVQPVTWLDLVHGRSSILFAVLAGVSIAIISGGVRVLSGEDALRARVRIFTRAALIFALGGLLEFLGTGVAVILPAYALLFVLSLPFLRWRPRQLFILAGILAVVAPVLQAIIAPFAEYGADSAFVDLFITGIYPGMIWIVFVLVGLGIGRLDLTSMPNRLIMLIVGAMLMIVGYVPGFALQSAFNPTAVDTTELGGNSAPVVEFQLLASIEPHSGTPFEVIGSTGFALVVLALCLVVSGALRWVLYPVAAVGSMALSAYSFHIVAIAAIGPNAIESTTNALWLVFVLAALLLCSMWAIFFGRGPLERILTAVSRSAARITPAPAGRLDAEPISKEHTEK